MTLTIPYLYHEEFGSGVGNLSNTSDIGDTVTRAATGGRHRGTYSATIDASFELSGVSTSTNSIVDGEVQLDIYGGNGSAVATGIVARISGITASGYHVRPVTPGVATVWGLYHYVILAGVETKTLIKSFSPAGVSAFPARVRYMIVGTQHRVKVWDPGGAEPSWQSISNTMFAFDSTKTTAGVWGKSDWGLNTAGDYGEADNFKQIVWRQLIGTALASASTSTPGTSLDTGTFDLPANVPAIVVVQNTRGSTPATTPTVTCSSGSVTVSTALTDTPLSYGTVASPLNKITIHTIQASVDVTGIKMNADWGAVTQTGANISVVRLYGGDNSNSNGSACIGDIDSNATDTNATSQTRTLAFANSENGAFIAAGHESNEATAVEAGGAWTLGHSLSHASPASGLGTSWRDANDTSPSMSWATGSDNAAWAAEIVLLDPFAEYGAIPFQITGAITPTGAPAEKVMAAKSGAITPAGAPADHCFIVKGGSLTPSGAPAELVHKGVGGDLTPDGDLDAGDHEMTQDLGGEITPAGALANLVRTLLVGTITPTGLAAELVHQVEAGTLTPTGAAAELVHQVLAGTISLAGAPAATLHQAIAGALTPSGATILDVAIIRGGTIAPAGSPLERVARGLTGTVGPTGVAAALVRLPLEGDLFLAAELAAEIVAQTARVRRATIVVDPATRTALVTVNLARSAIVTVARRTAEVTVD